MAENVTAATRTHVDTVDQHRGCRLIEVVRVEVGRRLTKDEARSEEVVGNQRGGIELSVVDVAVLHELDRGETLADHGSEFTSHVRRAVGAGRQVRAKPDRDLALDAKLRRAARRNCRGALLDLALEHAAGAWVVDIEIRLHDGSCAANLVARIPALAARGE